MAASFPNHIVSSFAGTRSCVAQAPAVRSLGASVSFPRSPSCWFLRRQFPGLSSDRRFPKASLKVSESNARTVSIDEDNLVQGGDSSKKRDQKGEATLKFLIQAYREAILSGDMESITSIELEIQALEKKRDELAGQVKEMTTEITTGKEKFLRLNADFENFRKRSEKDRLSFTSNIQRDVIESLLPIVDSFERARQQLKPETEKEKKIDTSYQGIYKQFVEILRSLRVAVVQTVGSQFDPSIHEAVGRVESQKFKEGVVVEEISRGFVLGDRVLRPAKVRVSAGAGAVAANDANPDAEGSTAEAAWPGEDSLPAQ